MIGLLVNNMWSFAGDWDRKRVSQMTAIFHQLQHAGRLVSDIQSDRDGQLGRKARTAMDGAFRRRLRPRVPHRRSAINGSIAAYYNVVRPYRRRAGNLRAQLAFPVPGRHPKPIEAGRQVGRSDGARPRASFLRRKFHPARAIRPGHEDQARAFLADAP